MTRARLPLLGLLVFLPACPSTRIGTAAVRTASPGTPCFTVDAKELDDVPDLRLHAVMLSDLSAGAATVWSTGVSSEPSPNITPSTCVRYGQGTERAPPHVVGHLYEVFVNASPPRNRGMTHGYTARFCLSDAGRAVPVPTDNRLDAQELCRAARSQ